MYYIYAYLRQDGTPYYIGKGKGRRAWQHNHTINLPEDKSYIVIMEKNLTEVGSLALERRYIRWYGRKDNGTGILRNLTDGGEGQSGFTHSNKTKQEMSKSRTGKQIKKLQGRVPWNKGKTGIYSKETIEKMKKAKEGYIPASKGVIKTEEHRRKISESLKGRIPWNKKNVKTNTS